MHFRQILSVHP